MPNPDKNHDTRHNNSTRSPLTSDSADASPRLTFADASDTTRDGIQHPFLQVIHSLYMCCRSRCYAPIKRIVPLFHSINTPTKTPSQRGRSTFIHSTGRDCTTGKCSAARWGAERPAKSGVPENNIPGPRNPPQVSAQQTTQPIRLTPSDHSGCNAGPSVQVPDPSVDSQG